MTGEWISVEERLPEAGTPAGQLWPVPGAGLSQHEMSEAERVCQETKVGAYCPSCHGIHRADGTYIPVPGGGR